MEDKLMNGHSVCYRFFADKLDDPVNDDWAVNALALASADSNNAGLMVRLFDDTTEEGIGFSISIPNGAEKIVFDLVSRADTAPGSAKAVVPKVYAREIPDNVAVESWSSGIDMTAIDIPTNENFQYDHQELDLTTLGLVGGRAAQIELTRNTGAVENTLVGDWALLLVEVLFI